MAKTQAEKKKESQARMAKNNGGNQRYGSKDRQESTKPVSLPYNFVSLPEQVIPAEFFEPDSGKDMKDLYKQHVLTNGKNSGYIDIDILKKKGHIERMEASAMGIGKSTNKFDLYRK